MTSLFQDFHEDFDKEVKLSLVDTEAVDDQRRTLEETWDTYKWASVRIETVRERERDLFSSQKIDIYNNSGKWWRALGASLDQRTRWQSTWKCSTDSQIGNNGNQQLAMAMEMAMACFI